MARPLRVAHATDIHWAAMPPLSRMFNKRLLGGLNLWIGGRRHHFSPVVQDALVKHIVDLEPDVVLITGDLTSLALDEEFAVARDALRPAIERFPTMILPGNHDVYTRGAARSRRFAAFFGSWMAGATDDRIARLDVGHLTIFGLDPNRPTLLSSGKLPDAQIAALIEALSNPDLAGRSVILALHYPVLDRRGGVYDNASHGLVNARRLIEVLREAPTRPIAIVHGHEHHGFRVDLPLGDATIPIFDPGSGGYAWMPERRRAACMNVYEIAPGGALRVERYMYGADGFLPEAGGAYATGR
jgi:3',5'-cyclic AMP phosphodiesterase CpdA